MRQVILDTETTGLSPQQGHRITEIGCVEMIDRKLTGRTFQTYLNPERLIDAGAKAITGLTEEFLQDKPKFHEVVEDFLAFVKDSQLIIHNAPFDVGFLDSELARMEHPWETIERFTVVIDTLVMAREKHPGQKNNLDALCARYKIDNSNREYHGALLDSEILARVYLAMTAGQTDMMLTERDVDTQHDAEEPTTSRLANKIDGIKVLIASKTELDSHEEMLAKLQKKSDGACLWSESSK